MGVERHFAYLPLKDRKTMHAAMVEALAARALSRPAAGDARQYQNLKLLDLAQLCEPKPDLSRGTDIQHLAQQALSVVGMHTSSDFPAVLADAANKVLLEAYQAQPSSYRVWASQRKFKDFRPHKFLRIGDFPSLVATKEPATVQWGTINESKQEVALATYTAGVKFTREALINDDLGALSDIGAGAAVTSARAENELSYGVLASNPTMADGEALFSEAHGNLAAVPSTIDVDNVALATIAMRTMTAPNGQPLNLKPKTLVCGPSQELQAHRLLAAIQPLTVGDVNPYSGQLELVIDAAISGNDWYLFCDPRVCASFVYGFLREADGPEVWITRDDDTRGLAFRCGLDFAVGAIDWRGAYKNAGA